MEEELSKFENKIDLVIDLLLEINRTMEKFQRDIRDINE